MKQADFTILENKKLTESIRQLRLQGDTSGITRPGQFVNLKLEGRFLRRPLSVCDCEDGLLTLIYKITGAGTGQLSLLPAGTKLDLLTGLGNGYDLREAGR